MQRFLLAVLVTLAVLATTYAETTCQSHQRASGNSPHGLNWKITCDANGDYEPLQCTDTSEKDKWCSCYDKEKQVAGPSKKLRFCECSLAKARATEAGENECNVPQCARNGKYEPKQCCRSTGKCHCVNPNTGAKTTEPTTNANLNCP